MRQLDPSLYVVTFRGIPIEGFATDSFINVAYNADTWSVHIGGKGEVTRVLNPDETATITLTLSQASPSNDMLSTIATTDRNNKNGYGALLIKDLNGTTVYKCATAWIVKLPDSAFGSTHQDRAWAIYCEKLKGFVGGSLSPAGIAS